jgi:hypothetical protein
MMVVMGPFDNRAATAGARDPFDMANKEVRRAKPPVRNGLLAAALASDHAA